MRYKITVLLISLCGVVHSCKKDEPVNPFDDPSLLPPEVPLVVEPLGPTSFAYLHKYVFKPTCANSGCHDGNFEPDYRTIYSTYNTLVYQPTISNDTSNSFTYRVLPGNAEQSMIHERLTEFLPNSSGVMPLSTDPGSDWPSNKNTYIQNIATWINNGAPDLYGNLPTVGNNNPEIIGLVAYIATDTTSPLTRVNGLDTPIEVPQFNTVDIWFAITDDLTPATSMGVNQYMLNTEPYNFEQVIPGSMQIVSPIIRDDFWGNPVSFTHKATIDLTTYQDGSYLYLRALLEDEHHPSAAVIPNDGSSTQAITYFSLKII